MPLVQSIIGCFKGTPHNLKFRCCNCEPITSTMVRANIWPATPVNPRIAFTFKLMDWAEIMLLECQVALKDLCMALSYKCPYQFKKVNTDCNECAYYLSVWYMCFNSKITTLTLLIHLKNIG